MLLTSDATIYRQNYQTPHFFSHHLDLTFHLDPHSTIVESQFTLTENKQSIGNELILNGSDALTLIELSINDKIIPIDDLTIINHHIHLKNLHNGAIIKIKNKISPADNHALTGVFITDDLYCSDCEPQGFRHITYFLDRPDNMATYRVTLIAPKALKELLSNGNLMDSGAINETHHFAVWEDPFPKPTYLFAIVAGNLAYIEDFFPRKVGTPVRLRIYADSHYIEQCHFALQALKNAMQWDEERFHLICDLDHYNIVAVNDFNGGAMENKGLNIFNSKFIFADPTIATDDDFRWVEAVIGHEYFHNWTGNRITCRDWFNLSLKEGLTVFREQEFIADRYHRGIKRIEDVQLLRQHQFPEDESALAHSVRPDSCQTIANLYTTTVYEKGAEIVRLYHTILGEEKFNRGFEHYIKTYDGQAVTTDQFLTSMEVGYGRSLPNFDRWYSQSGTPNLSATSEYDPITQTLRLSLTQSLPDTPHQSNKKPQIIPIKYAFINQSGEIILEELFVLQELKQCLLFHNVTEHPVISFLREFSAPVNFNYPYSLEQLQHLIRYETDYYARWSAAQEFYQRILLSHQLNEEKAALIAELFKSLLNHADIDPEFSALLLTLPTVNELVPLDKAHDALNLHQMLNSIKMTLGRQFLNEWLTLYNDLPQDTPENRKLRNLVLEYIGYLTDYNDLVSDQYYDAKNMTEQDHALWIAIQTQHVDRIEMLRHFEISYQNYPTVIDRWFSLQANNPSITNEGLDRLTKHELFSYTNPNRARSVIGTFGRNLIAIKRNLPITIEWLLMQIIKVDQYNSQTAARMVIPFSRKINFTDTEYALIIDIIENMMGKNQLSDPLKEQLTQIIQSTKEH